MSCAMVWVSDNWLTRMLYAFVTSLWMSSNF